MRKKTGTAEGEVEHHIKESKNKDEGGIIGGKDEGEIIRGYGARENRWWNTHEHPVHKRCLDFGYV